MDEFLTDNPSLKIRYAVPEDATYLTEWFSEPGILRWFPMLDRREIDDAVRIVITYAKMQATLTAEWDGKPCGMANLYLQPYKKLAHTCLFSIIVDQSYRGRGIGTALLNHLMKLAKEKFHIEILHLEVYQGNPAKRLYDKVGFEEFGFQAHFIKDKGEYIGKHVMQKVL